jgi:3-dehydroquinate synthase
MSQDCQILQKLTCAVEFPISFTQDVFNPENATLVDAMNRLEQNRVHRAMVFIDSNVADLFPQISHHVVQYFEAYGNDIELAEDPRLIPGGEILKDCFESILPFIASFKNAHLCRHSFVLIIGGGAVLDAIGFAAAIAYGGLRTIRIPTTLLAQASVGASLRTGCNFEGTKDALGSFYAPFGVINDTQFLYALPEKEWLGGVAELLRIAILCDKEFFSTLEGKVDRLLHRDAAFIQTTLRQASVLFSSEISLKNDPQETQSSQPLSFGYWAAHKLEQLSNKKVSYGEAVAMGVLLDCRYAVENGWMFEGEFARIHRMFILLGLDLWLSELEIVGADGNPEIFQGIPDFQERSGGSLSIVFPAGIGAYRAESLIDLEIMEQALLRLRTMASKVVQFDSYH